MCFVVRHRRSKLPFPGRPLLHDQQEMPKPLAKDDPRQIANAPLAALGLGALGVVFGDIGTSPLYTLKTVLDLPARTPKPRHSGRAVADPVDTLLITTVKYVGFAMSIDNDGEGGILALCRCLASSGSIVPSSWPSACSAQHSSMATARSPRRFRCCRRSREWTSRQACTLMCCRLGRRSGRAVRAAALGHGAYRACLRADHGRLVRRMAPRPLWSAQHPAVLAAINPLYGVYYLVNGGSELSRAWWRFPLRHGRRSAVRGHGAFRAKPIRLAWPPWCFPASLLNYAGQTAIVLAGAPRDDNIFFRLCPGTLLTRWSCWRRSPPSLPANRSSPAPFR